MDTLFSHAELEQVLANVFVTFELKGAVRVQLKNHQVEPALDAMGFLGEYYRLVLSFVSTVDESKNLNNNGSLTAAVVDRIQLFDKCLPQRSNEAEKEAIFKKEAQLYATLFQELRRFSTVQWFPTCYFTRADVIVMQDLKASGYELCGESLNEIEIRQLLRALAAMHAASIVYEVKNDINIGLKYEQYLQEITVSPNVAWYTTGLQALLAAARIHPKYQLPKFQHFISSELQPHLERVYEMMNPSAKYRNVLCQRDAWRGNIFFPQTRRNFDDHGGSAILVDYQTSRYCAASIDVIFAIFLNLETAHRLAKQNEYLSWYYKHFKGDLLHFGIKADQHMSEEDFLSSYKEFELCGHVYRTIAATIIKVPKEFVTNRYKYEERTEKVLEYMRGNADFRVYMEQCIEEMLESVLKKG